ncbi:MAG TPA: nitrate reductase subunit alpha [Baekduia sp.]|uniref:nitrate reductase subunit alpha n=1 Tax=Baekduia sp. TaxID=2600305 RepID=UPI002D7771CF|nr:nitrate reductase subunit alpha [Baekduia sp.]HET6508970.1 nitrate reductase subunit alpha [Baekduia sp.]
MTSSRTAVDGAVVAAHEFFRRGEASAEGWSMLIGRGCDWERAYRDRWAHDKVVRSTHGVNCTGSCSWNVYVKDGLITWETQAVDYPRTDPGRPDHEPRGCPRGASFSWYTYSPVRLRHPYVRGSLLTAYRAALAEVDGDPVAAFARVAADGTYRSHRGRGGFVRANWEEAVDLVAAATVHAIREHGPDRVAGFTPIPAMSPVSFSAGSRFVSLIGGSMLTFYDWYADLPPASPQVLGDQTDVPESADWWDAGYLIIWGTNLPMTRTPDAHFMTEARYRGQKVVVVSPDYSDHVKFADDWLPAQPGTDGALAMGMGHVILKETWVDQPVARFSEYGRKYTDLPMLVSLTERDGAYVPAGFLTAADLGETGENAEWKTAVLDAATGAPVVPNGSIGFRHGEAGVGRWNLDLGDVEPLLTLLHRPDGEAVEVLLPRFDVGTGEDGGQGGGVMRRGVPAIRVGDRLVTTVLDLTLATYGVRRDGLPGAWPADYDDASQPYTPAWQEAITTVDRHLAVKVAREFARNAEVSGGRSMICMGAGTNHWFHSDQTYRSFMSLLLMCGCIGVNGGGWAHYVGQEKIRTFAGWQMVSGAADWGGPPRQAQGTSWFYTHTEQWRYDRLRPERFASPLGDGLLAGQTAIDAHAKAVRMGWMPSFPTFDANPLDLGDELHEQGVDAGAEVAARLKDGRLTFAVDDPSAPTSFPRVLYVWRSNLLGSSGKGQEYFFWHLLGAPQEHPLAQELPPDERPRDVAWRDEAPRGKLDLLVTLDFRMTTTGSFSDVVLPAATWYEKHDLSMTDMHPFVHAFSQAVPPPWEARSDWDCFGAISRRFSELAADRLGVRHDVVATPVQHDTPGEIAQPGGVVRDWRAGECEPIPGRTMPAIAVVERDYGAVGDKWAALGPRAESVGSTVKSAKWIPDEEVAWLARRNGRAVGGAADGRPSLARAEHAAEAMLRLSAVTNGRLAVAGFRTLQERCGVELASLAEPAEDVRITFQDTQVQPRHVITSPEWSGIDEEGRAYAAFTINLRRGKPWHTLSGRMHFYLDHAWMRELGEALPAYRPPIDPRMMLAGGVEVGPNGAPEIALRYLTPHSKWSIHSEYQDNLHMLTLFRGGSGVWLSPDDAEAIGVKDNDWVEAFNKNGVVVARAVVSHRVPRGVCLLYHSKDRQINTPRSEIDGRRGGTENALTTIAMKPTHMIGGYAQLSFSPNYYGPTGSNRDSVAVVRRRASEVRF